MNVSAWFFTRKEKEPKRPLAEHCRTHPKRILQTNGLYKDDKLAGERCRQARDVIAGLRRLFLAYDPL